MIKYYANIEDEKGFQMMSEGRHIVIKQILCWTKDGVFYVKDIDDSNLELAEYFHPTVVAHIKVKEMPVDVRIILELEHGLEGEYVDEEGLDAEPISSSPLTSYALKLINDRLYQIIDLLTQLRHDNELGDDELW